MSDDKMHYENKTVTIVRGLEARSVARWESEGWETVAQSPATLMRTTLTFRRPKKLTPKWVWIAAAAAVVVFGGGIAIASTLEHRDETAQTAPSAVTDESPGANPTPTITATPSPAVTVARPTDAEIIDVFQTFFAERASSNVLYGKAVTAVRFENGVVRVTFDAAAAGMDQATFDGFAGDFNLPQFVATPIAFNNEVGSRVRPFVERIETVRADGTSLGTLDRAGILALNELSE